MTHGVLVRAFAKINYALEVLGLREDGYHEIRTVMQSVSLADEVGIERIGKGFELRVEPEGAAIGPAEANTVYGVWKLLCTLTGAELPVRVRLHKKIPPGAGLGGGSADAAAALLGLNELFGLGLGEPELRAAGGKIGADVPFCLRGGTALAESTGEVLSKLPAPPTHHLLIAKPLRGADTGEIYRAYDRYGKKGPASVEPVLAALRSGDLTALAQAVENDLMPVTARFVPEVAEYERKLLDAGALGAAMSGSGTAVFGLFARERDARAAVARPGASFAGAFEPVPGGVEML